MSTRLDNLLKSKSLEASSLWQQHTLFGETKVKECFLLCQILPVTLKRGLEKSVDCGWKKETYIQILKLRKRSSSKGS
ncbi:hypothetical protein FGSG_05917 [Fusarium graminearum PH-1]|uniref:hypothetical protein n=1 Tax=Gibberella zeae (strain ATCC MYA-4620 / CBS 123657 / FGSC 9075 / NRRL 31084 / PH-1) TaxID=229533 RepID=UPI00021F20A1|nr:hypothetical protein FGSG_05917 [Fusarium graminearum PH-1]ESU11950.1 hypothetical protein FGSG_05917 [Fusarium graminearum PH-1]EYB32961.1 hypothetical protein FG05_05917 [Fusarium graminearum]|eukprot:XP_011324526.1 hypothetical protein FGSG_05917 [Fusarium graminearum PH-1]